MTETTANDKFGLLRSWLAHRAYLAQAIGVVTAALTKRATVHDLSKLRDDEFEGFARINRVAREQKFGSPEYAESMKQERPTIDLHFSRNRHHAERPTLVGEAAEAERGLPDDCTYWTARDGAAMTWLDVVEMVCDWWAARKGYADNSRTWRESVTLNLAHKGKYLSPEMVWLAQQVAATLGAADE